MSYNTLRQLPVVCPICNHRSWHAGVQFKTGATPDFWLENYNLGDKLDWYHFDDQKYKEWLSTADRWEDSTDSAEEDLEIRCWNCRAGLIVTIYFESLFITAEYGVYPAKNPSITPK